MIIPGQCAMPGKGEERTGSPGALALEASNPLQLSLHKVAAIRGRVFLSLRLRKLLLAEGMVNFELKRVYFICILSFLSIKLCFLGKNLICSITNF